ncbi:lipoprotein LpqH [Mycobacterium sp. 050134]|uniref:lipoprotein LpqH n=1 Tax=Mycobacterium sp. 050134 TaxID=3096111 RepID=UPI002ED84403
MTNSGPRLPRRRIVLAVAGVGVVLVGGCSGNGGNPTSAPSSTTASVTATVMMDGNKHTMIVPVKCTSAAAQPNATPAESGDLTTRIEVQDESASVSMAISDEKPPSVDGFGISLKVSSGEYRLPYQAPQSATQVQATKDGKSYTVTGTGQGVSPNQGDVHAVTFGIHVNCP